MRSNAFLYFYGGPRDGDVVALDEVDSGYLHSEGASVSLLFPHKIGQHTYWYRGKVVKGELEIRLHEVTDGSARMSAEDARMVRPEGI